jgi:hexosaminidase
MGRAKALRVGAAAAVILDLSCGGPAVPPLTAPDGDGGASDAAASDSAAGPVEASTGKDGAAWPSDARSTAEGSAGSDDAQGDTSTAMPITLGPLLPANQWPQTIPAAQEWHAYGNPGATFTLAAGASIVVPPGAPADLVDAANVLLDDLQAAGVQLAVVRGASAKAGDIALALDIADPTLGTEGYVLTIGTSVTIHGATAAGVFWGSRTLLQLLRQSMTLPNAAARDWPAYPERGFMLDVGRAYFTPSWLENQIRDLAYVKLNMFHLHLSDSEGYRIESPSHPEIVSAQYLSRTDIGAITALSTRYHVEIVPEIDIPGHMDAVLAHFPQYVATQDAYSTEQIDFTIPAARSLAEDLLTENLTIFPGRYFHIGADEFMYDYDAANTYAATQYPGNRNAGGLDVTIHFINELSAIVRSHGKIARMWGDAFFPKGAVETLDPTIVVEYWINRNAPLSDFVSGGYALQNCNMDCTYMTDQNVLYTPACAPTIFQGNVTLSATSLLRGENYHWWCDPASSFCPDAQTVENRTMVALRALAQNTWGSPQVVTTPSALATLTSTIGRPPGYVP